MNKKVNIDAATFNFLYAKYKQYLLPVGVILACVFLFLFVVVPQFQNLLSAQEQAKVEQNKLAVLRSNLNVLSNLNQGQLDSQLQIVTNAFPPGKDFSGILSAVATAANRAGVFLGDYEFQVGDISKPNQQGLTAYPNLQLVLTVNGGAAGVTRFISELYKTAPVSEVVSVKMTNATSEVTANFYYRPFPPLGYNDATPISIVSPDGLTTINNLSKWSNISGANLTPPAPSPTPVSSPLPSSSQTTNNGGLPASSGASLNSAFQ